MLNLGFSRALEAEFGATYQLPDDMVTDLVEANAGAPGGSPELRTQAVYGDELWSRLEELGVSDLDWGSLRVLDACAGRGFLSFHLVERVAPRQLVLVDVSADELAQAEALLASLESLSPEYRCADLVELEDQSFDVVLGNSFVHHFPDVPRAIAAMSGLLRPGGWLIGLHEPTPVAVALESGSLRHVAACALSKDRYTERLRYPGPEEVLPGTTDIWMFEIDDFEAMLRRSGLVDVKVVPRYLLRPFVVAGLKMHLSDDEPMLSSRMSRLLGATVAADNRLARFLPRSLFGGFAFAARVPGS